MPVFSAENLLPFIDRLPSINRFVVGVSGGLDSSVLLHALVSLRNQGLLAANRSASIDTDNILEAIHVHHGINDLADEWQAFCVRNCHELSVPIQVVKVDASKRRKESPEESARFARYRAYSSLLNANDCLFMGHHQDDQAETMLLQLFRGAGLAGLAAMPELQLKSSVFYARPLLNFSRESLYRYAKNYRLNWVEDDSNQCSDFRRNFLRQEIIPLLKEHWPSVSKTISRSSAHCAQANEYIERESCFSFENNLETNFLQRDSLVGLDEFEQRYLIRRWLKLNGFLSPGQSQLGVILNMLLKKKYTNNEYFFCSEFSLRRFRNQLFLERNPKLFCDFVSQSMNWNIQEKLNLPQNNGFLQVAMTVGRGISIPSGANVSVRFRQGGEKIRIKDKKHNTTLKKLLQEGAVPPWLRGKIPLIYVDGQLVSVGGKVYSADFAVKPTENGFNICWEDSQVKLMLERLSQLFS